MAYILALSLMCIPRKFKLLVGYCTAYRSKALHNVVQQTLYTQRCVAGNGAYIGDYLLVGKYVKVAILNEMSSSPSSRPGPSKFFFFILRLV